MAQRVLAENAGVESVRYVLPNKHYIPVDMQYIGVDNTNPYVPETLIFSIAFSFQRLFQLWKTSSASCCGAEDDGGLVLFLDRMPALPSPDLVDLLRRESQ